MTEKLTETSTGNNEGAKMNTKTNSAANNDDAEIVEQNATDFSDQKNDILNFLCQNSEIYFKNQQIDDPELTIDEKRQIANDILENSHRKFLLRFGKYLQSEHLKYFDIEAKETERDENKMESDDFNNEQYEIKLLIKDLQKNIEHKQKNIKNRRYAAMQSMIKENSYFSEKEMMQREPHLYEELVGQYLTVAEKRVRDSYDPKNTTFTKIILDNYDKDLMNELRRKQEHEEEQLEEQMSEDMISESSLMEKSESSEFSGSENNMAQQNTTITFSQNSNRQQWGNFEDEDNNELNRTQNKNGTSTSVPNNKLEELKKQSKIIHRKKLLQQKRKYITAGEREMLRQEFVGIMYSKFLEGEDKDFDYSQVDNNLNLDDLKQIGQDDEDEYFDKDDDDDDDNHMNRMRMVYRDKIDRIDDTESESEDDLDVYMKHLRKNLALEKHDEDY